MSAITLGASAVSVIRSIQQGTIVCIAVSSGTATIVAVNPAKTFIILLSQAGENDYLQLTNSTTLTLTRSTATANITVNFMVVEFF